MPADSLKVVIIHSGVLFLKQLLTVSYTHPGCHSSGSDLDQPLALGDEPLVEFLGEEEVLAAAG